VRLTVHDVRGRLVETLWDGERDTGAHTVTWDGRGAAGSLPSGVYYVRLDVDGRVESKSVVLAR
jgi:flagellar hook assembly protein FlgD